MQSDSFFDDDQLKGHSIENFKLWTKTFAPLDKSDVRHEGLLYLSGAQSNGSQGKSGYYHLTPAFLYYSKVFIHPFWSPPMAALSFDGKRVNLTQFHREQWSWSSRDAILWWMRRLAWTTKWNSGEITNTASCFQAAPPNRPSGRRPWSHSPSSPLSTRSSSLWKPSGKGLSLKYGRCLRFAWLDGILGGE